MSIAGTSPALWGLTLLLAATLADAGTYRVGRGELNLRGPGGMRITGVRVNEAALNQAPSGPEALNSPPPFPQPPLAGFSPLVVMSGSAKRSNDDFNFAHLLEDGYDDGDGNPGNDVANAQYIVGVFDSGSPTDILAGPSAVTLGYTGDRLTQNVFPIGDVGGGSVNAVLSQPAGIFVQGLSAVDGLGALDLNALVGHTNSVCLVAPQIICDGVDAIRGVVGNELGAFYTTEIRVDTPRRVTVGAETFLSPDLQIRDPLLYTPPVQDYPRRIAMEFGGLSPVVTASYYAFLDPFTFEVEDPIFPTLLSLSAQSFPFGGAFFANLGVREGASSSENPTQFIRVVVDTGGQASLISSAVAANLNLPIEPDFYVDVCGFSGTSQLPGYYIDYVRINAAGGALEFSNAPFVVADIESPEGGPLDGILGMNFFHNRNIVFEPSLNTSGFIHVSNPIPFAYGDFDHDLDVDAEDFAFFALCTTSASVPIADPACVHVDTDYDMDVDQNDFAVFQRCLSGEDIPADVTCQP